jgi:hypothetical protein
MIYQEFIAAIESAGIYYSRADTSIEVEWVTGGVTGGGYWDGASTESRSAEPEPDFQGLDKLLEVFAPTITFLQYKALLREVAVYSDRIDRDYYGNHTNYACRKVLLSRLYEWLVERGFVTGVENVGLAVPVAGRRKGSRS